MPRRRWLAPAISGLPEIGNDQAQVGQGRLGWARNPPNIIKQTKMVGYAAFGG
jgi:hypothetical protein